MKALGARLGAALGGGETMELIGDVGAGKTTLVKGLVAGLKIEDEAQSPSFTISRVYDTPGGLRLAHYDFYRLQDPGILAAELAEVTADARTVTVIEWATIVEGVLPADRLSVAITPMSETSRRVELSAGGPLSRKLIGALA